MLIISYKNFKSEKAVRKITHCLILLKKKEYQMFTFSLLLVWIIFIQTYIVKTIASFIKYLKSSKNKINYTKLLFDCTKLYISIISFYLINHYVYLYQITVGLYSIKLFIFALFLTIFFLLIFILICCILNDLIEKIKSKKK